MSTTTFLVRKDQLATTRLLAAAEADELLFVGVAFQRADRSTDSWAALGEGAASSHAAGLLTGLAASLRAQGLADETSVVTAFASPRRLAARVSHVLPVAHDKAVSQKLMPVAVALDAAGEPNRETGYCEVVSMPSPQRMAVQLVPAARQQQPYMCRSNMLQRQLHLEALP